MQIVIPCGGQATRLGSIAENIPKSLVEINGRAFIEYQFDLIHKYKFDEIILCIDHFGEQIKAYVGTETSKGITVRYSIDDHLDVIGAVKTAEKWLQNHFFLMYGDSYLPFLDFNKMYQKYIQQNKLAMMAVWKNENTIDASNIKIENGAVTSVGDNDSDFIDYGTTILNKKILESVPYQQKYSTKKLWQRLVEQNQLAAYIAPDRFYHIGTPEALKDTRRYITYQ